MELHDFSTKKISQQTEHTRKRYNVSSVVYDLMEWPVEWIWYNKWRKLLWKKVEGPNVLEIGIGTGKNISYYPKNIQVNGIDLSPKMLERAKTVLSNYPNERVRLQVMDVQNLDFPDNYFDEVVATFVFCSVPDPILGLKEALRVTKPGGKHHLLEHMRSRNPLFSSMMVKLDGPIHYLSGVHIARQTVENVEAAGWKIEQVKDLTMGGIFKRIKATKSH
ncbi:MAG: SAM-dependent methyltransferase [Balneola sp.]|jgi:ubiquinone/menaquinone biosynthesis C-methylase UbiE|nr:SAM-dependent methyltransferase [Balneola sp.]MBE78326.1 SAM-dependent methyltransferase [Balneola sp.]|tara:strand:+ start:11567 stop:12226 length:660 start_codon:yes stop_codon:yes gene_type:complete